MKLKSANAVLFHYLDGQHEEVATWHDQVHRPSTHGMVPNVYYSQDWVAPSNYVAARPDNSLDNRGGEYATLFFSQGTRDEYERDSRVATQERNTAGRRHPHQDVVWRARMNALAAYARPDLEFAVDAVPLATNAGLILRVEELVDPARREAYAAWRQGVAIPRLMASGLFAACFECEAEEANGTLTNLQMYFVDRSDPLAAFASTEAGMTELAAGGEAFEDPGNTRRPVFSGVYRSMPPGKYDFYV
jgi:hypothetical protein